MKRSLLKTMFLLCALIVGSLSAWAEDVTLSYSGSTTTNMTGGNDAATVGLSATDWSVIGAKGGNSNFPGLNKSGYIAIYYNATASNTLTVSSLNDATINSITITYTSDTYNKGKVLVDGNEVAGTVAGTEGTYTINSKSFVITNGNTSNVQVRISSIEINYTSAGGDTPSISADDVEIAYNATDGEIEYTISNGVEGGVLTASTTSGWLSLGTVDTTIPFTCSANEGEEDRTATVTLTYTYNTSETVTKDITVTQAHYVIDFATLPFNWEGGASSALTALNGVTAGGLGSDYASGNSPYLVKLDGTGDYIQIKTDSQPGKVTIRVKMIGGDITSTITVQGSADGTNFRDIEVLTISGSQNDVLTLKTTNSFAATDRYVRLYFTKGANVGVGPISIAKVSTAPSITVAPAMVTVDADEHDGTLDLTYENLSISSMEDFGIQYYDAEGEEASEPDWIEVLVAEQDPQVGEGYVVSYYIYENEGAARTAYFKVFASGTTDYVYSNLVTITQAAYVAPPTAGNWVETPLADINANDVFVIVGDNGFTYAMSNDNGTQDPPAAVEVTVIDNTLSGTIADNIKWNISGDATDGYTFYPNGTDETWLYCTNTNNGVRVGGTNENNTFTIENGYMKHAATSRYVGIYNSQDWRCYTSTTGNIVGQTFKFYKQLAAKLNDSGYATFSATVPVDFSNATDYTAWVITGIEGTSINFSQITGAVPANTGVLLKGIAGEFACPNIATTGTAPSTNLLVAISTATEIAANQYYGLSGNTFVPVNAGTVPAGKALLPVSAVPAGSRLTFVFEDATGIATIEQSPLTNNHYYNLSGQRVDSPKKGMYIVNGKKVVVK